MKGLYLLLAACTLHAQTTLLSLIESAQTNERIESYVHRLDAAKWGHDASKRSYLPRVDGFANAAFVDHTGGFEAKQSYTAGIRGEIVVYDGSKRENLLAQNKALEHAARYTLENARKELSLEVIRRYFDLLNTEDEMKTREAMVNQLEAQLSRLEKFKIAGLASEDALMRIRSEVANGRYAIADIRYRLERQSKELETICGVTLLSPQPSEIIPPSIGAHQEIDRLKALKYSRDAKIHEAKTLDAAHRPTITLEDQYTFHDYRNDPIPQMRVDTQNKLIASLSINLLDFSASSIAKQALMAQAQAQSSDLAYSAKEAADHQRLSQRYIERCMTLIDASEKGLNAATQTFEAVKRKYEARIVDYVTYLDALRTLTDAANQLNTAKRTLHYGYAAYYFYAGHDPKEFVR